MRKTFAMLICLCLAGQSLPASASDFLEADAYGASRSFEAVGDRPSLDDVLLAQNDKQEIDVNIEVKYDDSEPRLLTKKQQRTVLGFMLVGGLAGALFGGVLGFLVGFLGAPAVWYLLDGADLLPANWR